MKPVAFDYSRPETEEETLGLLSEFGSDAVLLAGGMSLGPMLNLRLVKPSVVIDIGRVAGLNTVRVDAGTVSTGALLSQSDAMEDRNLISTVPLLAWRFPGSAMFRHETEARSEGQLPTLTRAPKSLCVSLP